MPVSHLPIRAFQWDLARQVERFDWLLEQLPRYADWGYQELYLHLEDAVEYPGLPQVARRGAYSYRQLEQLVAAATRAGLGVVPIVNLLGHTQYLIKVPALRDLNELRAPDGSPLPNGQICPLHPRTLEIAESLLRDMRPFCTTGKVHVGLDESFHLGRHPLSRAEVARIGLPAHFANYVRRLHALNQRLGLRTGLWADMLYFLPEAIPLLPRDLIAYDWYYYPFRRHPKVEFHNFAERDLATPLQQHGIEYWGCPMNGSFRFEPMPVFGDRLANLRSWWRRCREVKAQGFLVTSWESNRLAQETTTLVDAAAASLWLERRALGDDAMLAAGVQRLWGSQPQPARQISRALLGSDRIAFTGYARWEINRRWNLAAGSPKVTDYRQELQWAKRTAGTAKSQGWPEALTAACAFRRYLGQRDVFVREQHASVQAMRRALAQKQSGRFGRLLRLMRRKTDDFAPCLSAGYRAAGVMWNRTRSRQGHSPNRHMLQHDRAQLRSLRQWLAAAQRNPARAWTANPLGGEWQLSYAVWNFAPAVQQVAVQQFHHGEWIILKACHTIEFSAAEAVRRSRLVRYHSVPVSAPQGATDPLQLRFVLRGVGPVKIGRVNLSNGAMTLTLSLDRAGWHRFGQDAPTHGVPDLTRTWQLALPCVDRSRLNAEA
ncbi:MAG: family 20 glycosylhydrolase [Opitutaceae bacterium]|nr:family 20 glycosylhydrolase [Opitutaceae bacterium]